MTKEEIRQKAIKCGKAFNTMCESKGFEYDGKFPICSCEYNEFADVTSCSAVYGYEHGYADGIKEGKRLATKWIPVTERLPKEFGKSYIVCLKNGYVDIATSMPDGRLAFICEHCVREAYSINPIIAWMPLPEPFEEGEKA